jgi:hypothetical protein
MTIPTIRYLGLKIDRLASVTLKMANKRVGKLERIISNVVIIIMRVSTIVDVHVILEEDGDYPMILGLPWLMKPHVKNYWGKGYMTIRVHPNRRKIPFANFVKSSGGMSEYDDESETNQNSSPKGIYTDDSSEEEVGLYALEVIPKVGALFQADQRVQGDNDQSTPCVLTKRENRGMGEQELTRTRPSPKGKKVI